MKTRIEVTWPKFTGDEVAEMYGISKKRRAEIQKIADESTARVLARMKDEKA